jgi:hypothetical protein
MRENEVVVIFYDKLEPVLEVLKRSGAAPAAAIKSAPATEGEEVVALNQSL